MLYYIIIIIIIIYQLYIHIKKYPIMKYYIIDHLFPSNLLFCTFKCPSIENFYSVLSRMEALNVDYTALEDDRAESTGSLDHAQVLSAKDTTFLMH